LDVGLRVEPVALLEDPIQPVGEHRRDRALAAPGYAHHHDDGSLPRRRTGVFVGFSALSLAQARGWGAPRTRHSPRCPLLMALGHERSTYRWPLLPSAGGSILRVPGHAEAMGTAALTSARDSISRLKQLLHFGTADRMLQPVEAATHIQFFADLLDQRHDRQRSAGSDADARDADALELGQRGVRPGHNIDRHTFERPRQPRDSPDIGKAERVDAIRPGCEISLGPADRLCQPTFRIADILEVEIGASIDDCRHPCRVRAPACATNPPTGILDSAYRPL